MRAVSPKLMQNIEKEFMEKHNFPSLLLMERAALAVAKHCLNHCSKGNKIAVLAGCGNNGGDAYALARLLFSHGISCDVYALAEPKTPDAKENRRLLESIYHPNFYDLEKFEDREYAIIVDGIFGTGFKGAVNNNLIPTFERINQSKSYKISIDIPSGLNGETGYVETIAIKDDETICLQIIKQGLLLSMAPEYTGKIFLENIGIESELGIGSIIVDNEMAQNLLKPISPIAHKGKLGSVLIVAGSTNYAGAALMNCRAAINTGVGLITLASNEHTISLIQQSEMLPMGRIIETEVQKNDLLSELGNYDCISVGSGLEDSDENKAFVLNIIKIAKEKHIKCVLDAQALNFIAKSNIKLNENFLITPHPGEAARLISCSTEDVLKDYIGSCKAIYEKYGSNIILKGARSLIYDGENFAINSSGSPVLAKGGSGDCLCGIAAALIANNSIEQSIFTKAALACFILGRAGEIASKKYGEYSGNGLKAINLISASVADELLL